MEFLSLKGGYTGSFESTLVKMSHCWKSRVTAHLSCVFQSHSSVERAGLIAAVKMRKLGTDENYALRGDTLQSAIEEDKSKGLVPIFVRQNL